MNKTLDGGHSPIVQLVAGISEAIAISCLICYCYVIVLFLKHATFRRNLFYWLLIHLGATDIGILLLFIFYGGPKTLKFYVFVSPILPKVLSPVISVLSDMSIPYSLNSFPSVTSQITQLTNMAKDVRGWNFLIWSESIKVQSNPRITGFEISFNTG